MKIILEVESVAELRKVFAQLSGGLVSEDLVSEPLRCDQQETPPDVQAEIPSKKKRGKKEANDKASEKATSDEVSDLSPASPSVEHVDSDTIKAIEKAPAVEEKAVEEKLAKAEPLDATVGIKKILTKFGQKDGIPKAREILSKFLAAKASDLKPEQILPFLEMCEKACA